ncbi:hypothetical protein [Stenotrophomonas sp.]|uniref:hypothetical protein n=1 Tax=Stenotrophomonas sp. TaxID=69392 RepID=UPI0028AB0C92|nr:hypothetical protein [Stenotrophomonas sp.]
MDSYKAGWRTRLGLGAVALALAGPALAEDWWTIYVGENPLELTIMLVDAGSLKPDPSEPKAVRFQEMILVDGMHVVTDSVIRCNTKQSSAIGTATYFNDGRPSPSTLKAQPGWKNLRTDAEMALYEFVCPPQRREGLFVRNLGDGVDRMSVVTGLAQAHEKALPELRRAMAETQDKARMAHDLAELDRLLGNTPGAPATQPAKEKEAKP